MKPDHAAPNRSLKPAGPHSLVRLRIWSGAKKNCGLAPGSTGARSSGDDFRCVSPMIPLYHLLAEVPVQRRA